MASTRSIEIPCFFCRKVLTVNPSMTSVSCSGCNKRVPLLKTMWSAEPAPPPPPPPPPPTERSVDEGPSGDAELYSPPPQQIDEGPSDDDDDDDELYYSDEGSSDDDDELYSPPPEEINEVAVEVEQEEDSGVVVGETFTDYRPSKLSIGHPHPDPVVETASLSAVQPPEPTYNLQIRDDLERSKALSCLQIETVVYASQKHLQHLSNYDRAGFFLGDGAGVGKGRTIAGLILENWQHGRRKALWISVASDLKFDARRDLDDVGAKSIEVHSLNKLSYSKLDTCGVREGVIFLTYSTLVASSGKGDSRLLRLDQLIQWCGPDFDGLIVFDECHKAKNLVPEAGGQPTRTGKAVIKIQDELPEARVVYCSATGASELRNMGYMTRLGLWGSGTSFLHFRDFLGSLGKGGVGALELVAMDLKARGMYLCRTLSYKGAEFEVVEVPLEDKMMAMYNRAAEFWADLREKLLSELVVYEGKPESDRLWSMYWAAHQRFFKHMCISAKVPAVVDICCRALSEDKCVVIGLQSTGEARTEEAVANCGELVDFISGPRELLLKFVEKHFPLPEKPVKPKPLAGENGVKEFQRKRRSATNGVLFKGRARKAARLQDEIDTETKIHSEPESTGSGGEFNICDICNSETVTGAVSADWTCMACNEKKKEYLQQRCQYLAELERYNETNNRKLQILEAIRSLHLPNNPLDDIIDKLGGPDKVAEITGRRHRLIKASDGRSVTYEPRNTKDVAKEMVNMNEKQLFMDGKKLVAIISEAASAGVSLQADRRALNQRRRVHITLELPWSADRAIQQFGRTHRSNQTSAPEYRLLFSNLGGERRFVSTVAKRLESLGALTQGDRRSAGPSLSAYNYDSVYGKIALENLYSEILEQSSLPVAPPGCSLEKLEAVKDFAVKGKAALESVGIVKDKTYVGDRDMHDVTRFLNRLLGIQPKMQNLLFESFVSKLDLQVQEARHKGHFDSGIADVKANAIELKGPPKNVHIDQLSGASTVLVTLTLDRGFAWEAALTLLNEKKKDVSAASRTGFYKSTKEWLGRRHCLLAIEGSSSKYRIFRPATGEAIREMPLTDLEAKYDKFSSLEEAHTCWDDEYLVSFTQCMHGPKCKRGDYCTIGRRIQEVNVLSGLVLPVWGTIQKTLAKQIRARDRQLRIVRVETTGDNKRIVGLLIPNAAVNSLLKDLAYVQNVGDDRALKR